MERFQPYQTDVLFLLVGSNPLPNYVAARLMVKETGTVVLLHSKSTTEVAKRLATRLQNERPDLVIQYYTVPEADGPAIAIQVENAARSFERSYPRKTVGLNYTGGTKPMAAYSYRVLSQMFSGAVCSYLDARTLSMVVDPGGGPVQYIRVERNVSLKLKDIIELHGYSIETCRTEPICEDFAQAIAEVNLSPEGMKQWYEWRKTLSNEAKLPTLEKFPKLAPIIKAFDAVCGGRADEACVAQALGFQVLRSCANYFKGVWLEDVCLRALRDVDRQIKLDSYAGDIKVIAPGRSHFQLDAAATIGYQLFAISCIATEDKDKAKEHFLEVFTRSKQLGGDEARYATVSFCNDGNVKALELEVAEAWDAQGKIKVFGRSHIRDLSTHLLRWFREANQEAS